MNKLFLLLILSFFYNPLFSQKVEKLLGLDKVEKAIAYCEKQNGADKSECFMKIANYYLSKGDYSAAEDYFDKSNSLKVGYLKIADHCLSNEDYSSAENYYHKSGKIKEGYVKMAESYMKGVWVDSTLTLIFDNSVVKNYLKEVYTDDEQVYTEMAKCYEKYAIENDEHTAKMKELDEAGVISWTLEGKYINIELEYKVAKIYTELYYFEAADYYEKAGNIEKAEEMRKKLDILKMGSIKCP